MAQASFDSPSSLNLDHPGFPVFAQLIEGDYGIPLAPAISIGFQTLFSPSRTQAGQRLSRISFFILFRKPPESK